ncbi:MAG: V-type ATP synthase subunit B, partial [Desulfuromonadales bacterium]|nr:V-type ATP synthase subunit B [Desulfuromonadales bacterium]NIR33190.1 V-type ATP synthase subunit B [Desulfuromonadales bacterium]NIS41976.1 V-type ATP synthase subunit B [Desulfuromonadales bacterium]
GPLIFIEGISDVGFSERVEIVLPDGEQLNGRVMEVDKDVAVVEVFEGTGGIDLEEVRVRFLGEPFHLPVSPDMLGRVFDGLGRPLDGGPPTVSETRRDVNGGALNPVSRAYPEDFIETGISVIDGMNTLVRGQKLPIFSASGLPHNKLAGQIIQHARIGGDEEDFALVFAAIGVKHDVARMYQDLFEAGGVTDKVVMFLNLADDPSIVRLLTPRVALTTAEYLAFDMNKHVLVLLTDMTNYGEALREVSTSKGEVPSRKGFPGYLYSDLASIFERAGRVHERRGSITQMPILTMPNDDITHPIPDLTGYITEGQIVLDRNLQGRDIYPPINPLPSLSRLMNDGIGKDKTREDHEHLSSQLYAAYAQAKQVEKLSSIIGEEELSQTDRLYLEFAREFEDKFISQDPEAGRSLADTLSIGWECLRILPEEELTRVSRDEIERY